MSAFRVIALVFLYAMLLGCEREGIYDLASHEDSIQVLYSNDGFATTSWDVSHNDVGFPEVILPGSSQYHFKIVNISGGDVILTGTGPATPTVELILTTEFTSAAPNAEFTLPPGAEVPMFFITFNPAAEGEYYSAAHIRYRDAGDSQIWVYSFEVRGRATL